MKKRISLSLILSTLVCLSPLVATPFLYDRLPDELITSWGFNGQPQGTSPKEWAAIGMPVFMAVINLTLYFAIYTDPKQKNASKGLVTISKLIVPLMSVFMYALIIYTALYEQVNPSRYVVIAIGIIFVLIGNYLPKSRQSYTVGIKTPWALHDEENWNKTHRLAGPIWVAAGFLVILSSFTPFTWLISLLSLSTATLIPFAYSYLLYKRSGCE